MPKFRLLVTSWIRNNLFAEDDVDDDEDTDTLPGFDRGMMNAGPGEEIEEFDDDPEPAGQSSAFTLMNRPKAQPSPGRPMTA